MLSFDAIINIKVIYMNFDLNIENYTRDELIQMFELPLNFDKSIDFLQLDIKNNSIIVKTMYEKINNDMLIYKN